MSKIIERSALVPHKPEFLFDLVNDVASYPEFMDGCVGSEIYSSSNTEMRARLDLRKGKFAQSFTTENKLNRPNAINMSLVDGPFNVLNGNWSFEAIGDIGTKVSFHLEFEFKNKLLQMTAGKLFESVANQMVDAIVARANQLSKF